MHGKISSGFADLTAVRLRYRGHDYNITPNRGKPPVIKLWNTPEYLDRELRDTAKHTAIARVRRWEFLYARAISTGVRLDNGLAAIDGDILDAALAAAFAVKFAEIAPDVVATAPLRTSVDPKFAYFVRIADGPENVFVRVASAKYATSADRDAYQAALAAALAQAEVDGTAPVPVAAPKSHGVEIWGGARNKDGNCSRQFGVDGVHKLDDTDTVPVSWYGWADDRPALHEVALEALPVLTRAQAYEIVTAFEALATAHGLVQLEVIDAGEGEGEDIFDLNPAAARFDVYQGESQVSYAELEDMVVDGSDVRISPNFIAGEASETLNRCMASWSTRFGGCLVIKDWKGGGRHYAKAHARVDIKAFGALLKEKLPQAAAGAAKGSGAGNRSDSGEKPPVTNLMQTSAEFVAGYVPPDYLIDGLLQRRYVYSFTAPTGGGKTSIALLIAAHVAQRPVLAGREVEKGRVLFFAGENPDDVRTRWIMLCEEMKIDPDSMDVVFMPFTLDLSEQTIRERIDAEAAEHGPFSLLIVDTVGGLLQRRRRERQRGARQSRPDAAHVRRRCRADRPSW